MAISIIEHKGHEIISVVYTDCKKPQEQIDLLDKTAAKINAGSDCLLLVDYEGISVGVEYMNKLKTYGKTLFKQKVKFIAVLGIKGLKKILFDGYNRATGASNTKSFLSKEDALEWLSENA